MLLFFWNFLLRGRYEWNGTIIFIFPLSHPFPSYFALRWIRNSIFFYFLCFFAIFLDFSITHQVGTKRNDNFYFLYFSSFSNLFLPEMKAIMVFFNFFNFFALFLELSVTRQEGTKRNGNFYFLSFCSFSNLFLLEMKP